MKDKNSLIESLDRTFQEYAENLWLVPDPTLLKSEFDEMWCWSVELKTDQISVDDILCVSDMVRETKHQHLFPKKKDQFEFKF